MMQIPQHAVPRAPLTSPVAQGVDKHSLAQSRALQIVRYLDPGGPQQITWVHNHALVRGWKVVLNVYDLLPPKLNGCLSAVGLGGAYHSGVEVGGTEYAFGGHWSDTLGIMELRVPMHLARKEAEQEVEAGEDADGSAAASLEWLPPLRKRHVLGWWMAPVRGFQDLLAGLQEQGWTGPTYRLLTRNCNHFVLDLCAALLAAPDFKAAPGRTTLERMVPPHLTRLTTWAMACGSWPCCACCCCSAEKLNAPMPMSPASINVFQGEPRSIARELPWYQRLRLQLQESAGHLHAYRRAQGQGQSGGGTRGMSTAGTTPGGTTGARGGHGGSAGGGVVEQGGAAVVHGLATPEHARGKGGAAAGQAAAGLAGEDAIPTLDVRDEGLNSPDSAVWLARRARRDSKGGALALSGSAASTPLAGATRAAGMVVGEASAEGVGVSGEADVLGHRPPAAQEMSRGPGSRGSRPPSHATSPRLVQGSGAAAGVKVAGAAAGPGEGAMGAAEAQQASSAASEPPSGSSTSRSAVPDVPGGAAPRAAEAGVGRPLSTQRGGAEAGGRGVDTHHARQQQRRSKEGQPPHPVRPSAPEPPSPARSAAGTPPTRASLELKRAGGSGGHRLGSMPDLGGQRPTGLPPLPSHQPHHHDTSAIVDGMAPGGSGRASGRAGGGRAAVAASRSGRRVFPDPTAPPLVYDDGAEGAGPLAGAQTDAGSQLRSSSESVGSEVAKSHAPDPHLRKAAAHNAAHGGQQGTGPTGLPAEGSPVGALGTHHSRQQPRAARSASDGDAHVHGTGGDAGARGNHGNGRGEAVLKEGCEAAPGAQDEDPSRPWSVLSGRAVELVFNRSFAPTPEPSAGSRSAHGAGQAANGSAHRGVQEQAEGA